MDAAERLDALKEIINDLLEDWGFDEVDVIQGDLSTAGAEGDAALGSWDFDQNTITLDYERTLERDSFDEALDTAIHEATHAARDHAHGQSMGTGGGHRVPDDVFAEFALFGDEVEVYEPGEFVPDDLHREAYIAAEEWVEELLEECPDDPAGPQAPSEYGVSQNAPSMTFTEEEVEAFLAGSGDDEEMPDCDMDIMPDGDLD
jgi:hypothetical protein